MIIGLAAEVWAGMPVTVVAVWGLLTTAVYVAVGLYIRSELPGTE